MARGLVIFLVVVILTGAVVTIYQVVNAAGPTDEWRVPAPSHTNELKTATQPAMPARSS